MEVSLATTISFVIAKQWSKLISKHRNYIFLMILSWGKKNMVATTSRQGPLNMTPIDGQGRGGVQGYFHLPNMGASMLSIQAQHRSDPRYVVAK